MFVGGSMRLQLRFYIVLCGKINVFVCNVFLHHWGTGEVLNNDDKPVTENMPFGHWHEIKYCPIICHILGLPCE